jgi:methylamine---glutamate N-methyltransferase subunit B
MEVEHTGSAQTKTGRYDVRGLAEPDAEAPNIAEINGTEAEFDAHDLSTRQINLELRRLLFTAGVTEVTIRNPRARHSIAVGVLTAS